MINLIQEKLKKLDCHSKEVLLKSSSSFIVQVIGISISVVISIFVGRLLGVSGLGDINLVNKIIAVFLVFSLFGMDNVLLKKVSIGVSDNNPKLIGNSIYSAILINFCIAFLLGLFGIIFTDDIASILNINHLKKPLIILFIALVPKTISIIFTSGINGYRKVWQSRLLKEFMTSLVVFLSIGIYWFLGFKITVYSVLIFYALGQLISFLLAGLYWKNLFKPFIGKRYLGKSMLKPAIALLFVSSTSFIASSSDIIMLGWLSNSSKVGLYSVASRLVMFIAFFLHISNSAISPKIATLFKNNRIKELNIMTKQVTFWLIIIGIISLVFFLLLGKQVLGLWGEDFSGAYSLLIILSLGQFINISTGCSGLLLIMCGHEKALGYISSFFVIINLVLNYFLIIEYEAIGAAIATTITIVGENITKVIVAKQKTGILTLPTGLKN